MMNPQNVIFLVSRMPIGGSETFLINILKMIGREKITPIIISLGSESDPMYGRIPEGTLKYVFPRKWRFDFSPCYSIKKVIDEYQVNTVVAVDYFTHIFLQITRWKWKANFRSITLMHSTKPRYLKEYLQGLVFARLLSKDDEVITTCLNQKEYLRKLFFIPKSRLKKVIYNGIDTNFWTLPDRNFNKFEQRKKLGIPGNAIVIINVAGFRKEKRHDVIIKGFAKFQKMIGDKPAFLLLVGGGDSQIESEMKQLAKSCSIADKVIFMGVQDDLKSLYWLSDIFTLGSSSETFSIAALEALSTGLPSVLTNVGGASEMISEGLNGYLAEPGSSDSLASAWLKCTDLLPKISHERIREIVVSRFDIRECVHNYEEYILNLKSSE